MDIQTKRERQRGYQAKWYAKNRDKQSVAVRDREEKLLTWWRESKSTLACWNCGENHPDCIEFHHVIKTPTETHPGNLIRVRGWGKARIQRELENCVPLCANCHRKVHAMHRELCCGDEPREC